MWFYKDGTIDRIGNIKNGELDGPFIRHYKNGNKEQELIWEKGDIINWIDYNEDGSIKE